jgi:hypothetical protein
VRDVSPAIRALTWTRPRTNEAGFDAGESGDEVTGLVLPRVLAVGLLNFQAGTRLTIPTLDRSASEE